MKDLTDHLKTFIESKYQSFLEENGFADREFFESAELRNFCKESLKLTYPLFFGGKTYDLTDEDFLSKYLIAVKDMRFRLKTIANPSKSIVNDHRKTWLDKARIIEIGWEQEELKTYRSRYLKYLTEIGRSKSIVKETMNSSLEIMEKIGDPKNQNDFFVKGLVVGSVQSGKTSNFNAVVNSSIDVGYKLIIVLSGIMEDLRRQTQIRIEKEVVGKMVSNGVFLGVGSISSFGQLGRYGDVNQVIVPTSTGRDFNRTMKEADFNLNSTNILICKKNTSVLQNLILWLNDYLNENNDKHSLPFLIIDDEADNASLNNLGHQGKDFANKINGHIRALLGLFKRKTYIGYTATPFANVLQDWNEKPTVPWEIKDPKKDLPLGFQLEGNLFPDDFIVLLRPPSNYIGPKHFFETRIEEVKKIDPLLAEPLDDYIDSFPERVAILADGSLEGVRKYRNKMEFDMDPNAVSRFGSYQSYRDKDVTRATTKYDNYPVAIPKSLDEAIKCFIISIAIRLTRRPELIQSKIFHPHNTMLIHISRFSDWQCTTKTLVKELVVNIKRRLDNDPLTGNSSIFKEFERIWIKYFAYAINNIREYLPDDYEDEYLSKKNFEEIKHSLIAAITGIDVLAVNTVEKDQVDYESGEKKYIVIGGNKLSRGFTLEGLTVNYFLRNTNYADTLLQMGRWFGYRPGYIDCCKLFTTLDTFNKFDQCTWTIESLEQEFIKIADEKLKPKDYATKVLTHPGVLQITRPAILKNAVSEKWSFEDSIEQTTEFQLTKDGIENSWENFKATYRKYSSDFTNDPGKFMILKTDIKGVKDFFDSQLTFTDKFEKDAILRFIRLSNKYDKLKDWTIAIKTSGSTGFIKKELTGFLSDIQLKKMSSPSSEDNRYVKRLLEEGIYKASGKSSNIITSGKDFSITLSDPEIDIAHKNFANDNIGKAKLSEPPEKYYRALLKDSEGLMIIYVMDLKCIFNSTSLKAKAQRDDIDLDIPLVGFALAIPKLQTNIGGEYLLNKHILENIRNNPGEGLEEDDENNEIGDDLAGFESEL